jgi:parallel beta-helix repeat protein
MRNRWLGVIISAAIVIFPAHATTYYICDCQQGADANCVKGNDNATGRSAATPWQTFDKAMQNFGALVAGDTVAFARGASFSTAGGRWVNYNATAKTPVVVTAYTPSWASGDEAKPVIRSSSDCFRLENGGNARHKEGMVIEKLHLIGPSGASWAIFLYNDIDDVVIDSMQIDSFSIGVHCSGANTPDSGSNGLNERITLKNSNIRHCSGMGFLGSAPDLLIQNCRFDDNGYAQAVFNHNVYISGEGVRERVIGNVLTHGAMVAGQCQGVSLVVHGIHKDLTIENNIVQEDTGAAGGGCYGIAMDAGYGTPEVFRNVTIRRNLVVNVGYIGIGVSSCRNCLIENNIVIQNQRSGGTGIAAPDRDLSAEDTASDSITVRNNTVYFGAKVSSATGILLSDQGSHHVCANNLVFMAGAGTTGSYLSLNLPSSSYSLVDYNIGSGGAAGVRWEENTGALAAWSSQSGWDTHSRKADPLLPAAAGAPDQLVPPSGSPAVNAALPSSSPADDYTGTLRDNAPDIGALEYRSQATIGNVLPGTCRDVLDVVVLPGRLRMALPLQFAAEGGRVRIFSVQGKLVCSILVEKSGSLEIPWRVPGGVYIALAQTGTREWRRVFADRK